jgi:hypothetical protein
MSVGLSTVQTFIAAKQLPIENRKYYNVTEFVEKEREVRYKS